MPQPYCRPCMVAYHAEWRRTTEGAAKVAAAHRQARTRYPERVKARGDVRQALLGGRLAVGPCYADSAECRGIVEAHHEDYARPLDVVWTCRRHHRALDAARRDGAA